MKPRYIHVTVDKWRAGVKFLRGYGVNPELSATEQLTLRAQLVGPFANGMDAQRAARTLHELGWRIIR